MNEVTEKLVSLQLERNYLSALCKFNNLLYETEQWIVPETFVNQLHQTIFLVARSEISEGKQIDQVLLAQKVKGLLISFKDSIDIYEYINNFFFSQINLQGGINSAKQLAKLHAQRLVYQDTDEVRKYLLGPKCSEQTLAEIIANVDSTWNKRISTFITEDNPSDLVEDVDQVVNERALNPVEEIGIKTQFKIYNEMFSGLRTGVSSVVSRAKAGKSTFLINIAWGAILNNKNIKCIYLDTELKKDTNQFRLMSAFSQVPCWYIESGQWTRNKDFCDKINNSWKQVNELKGKLYHYYIGNKTIEQVASIIRRWYYSICGRGNPCLIIYDYIKLGSEKLSNFNQEYQALGHKINYLNEISQQLNAPIFTACQLNRTAITENRDDESAISMTDRLSWFGNSVCIFRKKRPEEISEEGIQFGTHKLIPLVTRFQGKNTNNFDLVKVSEKNGNGVLKQNFISYNVSNFMLEERGTLRDIINHQNLTIPLTKSNKDSNEEDKGVEL